MKVKHLLPLQVIAWKKSGAQKLWSDFPKIRKRMLHFTFENKFLPKSSKVMGETEAEKVILRK